MGVKLPHQKPGGPLAIMNTPRILPRLPEIASAISPHPKNIISTVPTTSLQRETVPQPRLRLNQETVQENPIYVGF
jgi:hypothetical protein